MHAVLQVDKAGTPQDWLTPEDAATIICAGHRAWQIEPIITTLRGGWSNAGVRSTLDIPAILATDGMATSNLADMVPTLGRHNYKLFERDRHMCAYCGEVMFHSKLTREHVVPTSRGGHDEWTNVVTACGPCNRRKAARTPEEAHMQLIYTPYAPNWFEDFLLQRGGKKILADQMDFLLHRVDKHSRMRAA
jgi:hypothetical protein